jgi:RNA polymerase sigma factor (sigma-70 family)
VDYQKLLLEHLALVDRLIGHVARRHHFSSAHTEEFASLVRFKLIDQDFAILRKFQGRSNLSTYLTAVIEHIYLDFCVAKWGKWRPSAAARRLGPLAMLLEQLVSRDHLTFDEAVTTLEINHGCTATRDELRAMLVQLPTRTASRLAAEKRYAIAAARAGARDPALDREEDAEIVERIEAVLARALAGLPARDQLLLKLRFQEGLTAAAVARFLHAEEKPVQRQLRHTMRLLHHRLREEGIAAEDIGRIVGHPALTLGQLLAEMPRSVGEPDGGSV